MRKHINISGLAIPDYRKDANQNLDVLVDTIRRLTDDGATNTIEVCQYKSGRYYAKSDINKAFKFTCGLEVLDMDYGCQVERLSGSEWKKEDLVRSPMFGKLMDYLDKYVTSAASARKFLK